MYVFNNDLVIVDNLGEMKCFFNSTSGINDISELKSMVTKTLTKNGKPINELNDISLQQVKKILGDRFGNITINNKSNKLIEALENDSFFEEIFQIVD